MGTKEAEAIFETLPKLLKDKINSLGARIIIEELLIETFNAGYKFGKSIHKK